MRGGTRVDRGKDGEREMTKAIGVREFPYINLRRPRFSYQARGRRRIAGELYR